MVEGAAEAEAGAAHQLQQRGLTSERGSQYQGVDEKADDAFGFKVLAAGGHRAESHIVAVGETAEDFFENRRHHHKKGFAPFLEETPELGRQVTIELESEAGAAFGEDRRSAFFRRQLERLEILKLAAPIVEQTIVTIPFEALRLPGRVVAVTQAGSGQRRAFAALESAIKRGQVAQQEVHRPAVGSDVVHGQQETEGFFIELDQRGAVDRPGGQIEGLVELAPFEFFEFLRHGTEVEK